MKSRGGLRLKIDTAQAGVTEELINPQEEPRPSAGNARRVWVDVQARAVEMLGLCRWA